MTADGTNSAFWAQGRREGGRGGMFPRAPIWRGAPEIVTIFLIYFFLRLRDCRQRKGPTKREVLECAGAAESAGPHKAQGALGSVRPPKVWASRMREALESKGPQKAQDSGKRDLKLLIF